MEKRIIESLQRCPLFRGVEQTALENLMEHVAQCRIIYPKGQTVRTAGSVCRYADIILKGELLARMTGPSRREVEVSRFTVGNVLSPAFIFADNHSMPVTVVATKDTEILRLEPEELLRVIDDYPAVRLNFITTLSNIIAFLTCKIKTLVLLSVKEKVAQLIIHESDVQQADTISLPKSRQALADNFGIQKNSLTRALHNWASEGAISVNGRTITILDRDKLQCPCP
jgi:CRP-like cAMP-binding protein